MNNWIILQDNELKLVYLKAGVPTEVINSFVYQGYEVRYVF